MQGCFICQNTSENRFLQIDLVEEKTNLFVCSLQCLQRSPDLSLCIPEFWYCVRSKDKRKRCRFLFGSFQEIDLWYQHHVNTNNLEIIENALFGFFLGPKECWSKTNQEYWLKNGYCEGQSKMTPNEYKYGEENTGCQDTKNLYSIVILWQNSFQEMENVVKTGDRDIFDNFASIPVKLVNKDNVVKRMEQMSANLTQNIQNLIFAKNSIDAGIKTLRHRES